MSSPDETPAGPVIRDLRRIDPATGQVRGKPAGTAGGGGGGGGGAAQPPQARPADAGLASELAERTADLQRVTAEYANYRKRVERDRLAMREQALANVLMSLIPVLDDIGRAREHGELVGGFKSVAEALEAVVTKLGLASYGDEGEPFDPKVHEALTHSYSADVSEPTCVAVLQPGYKVGDRILRAARVAVAEPGGDEPPASGETAPGDTAGRAAAAGQASGVGDGLGEAHEDRAEHD